MAKKVVETQEMFIGKRIQLVRRDLGLSIDDIAKQLNLTTEVIQYLESDNYKMTKKDVFYRGYLRSYARLLGLPEDEIINSYVAIVGKDPISIDKRRLYGINTGDQPYISRRRNLWLGVAAGVVIVCLSAYVITKSFSNTKTTDVGNIRVV